MGKLFINIGNIYCFETGFLISISKKKNLKKYLKMYINISILSKTVNLHCKAKSEGIIDFMSSF